jgi:hypothetical protein
MEAPPLSCPIDSLPDSILADILTRSAAWHGWPRDIDDSVDRTIEGYARGWPEPRNLLWADAMRLCQMRLVSRRFGALIALSERVM